MSTASRIEWTDATWNPVVGCTRVSAACDNCYAVRMTHRQAAMADARERAGRDPGRSGNYGGLTVLNPKGDRHFNGEVRCVPEALGEPLRWRRPRMVFTASMSDIFHPRVPFEFLDRIFAVMALCPQHTFQVLTKRPERMVEYLTRTESSDCCGRIADITDKRRSEMPWNNPGVGPLGYGEPGQPWWPLPNVWLGTTVEDQAAADARIPHLLRCPAAVRFVSCEPLLGEIGLRLRHPVLTDLMDAEGRDERHRGSYPFSGVPSDAVTRRSDWLHWVITGGETGPADRVRRTDHAWLRSLRDQCRAAGVPFFLKQITERGNALPEDAWPDDLRDCREWPEARA